jgi:hypothetical protein
VWLLLTWAASPIAFLEKVKEDFTKNMVVGKQLLQQLAAWSLGMFLDKINLTKNSLVHMQFFWHSSDGWPASFGDNILTSFSD